jgi:hypothetical protein
VNPFEIFSTDSGPASGYYAPNAELELNFVSGSGYFVLLNSAAPAPANGDLILVGNVKSIGFSENAGKIENAVFNIPLSETQLKGFDAANLNLYGWDSAGQKWNPVSGGTNDLKHFSIELSSLDYVSYALFAPQSADTTPPSAVSDLKAETGDSRWRIVLEWTAPSDSGKAAFAYSLRFNTAPITDLNWEESVSVGYVPEPASPGTVQQAIVEMPDPNTEYYFAVRSADAAGNLSPLSVLDSPANSSVAGDFNCDSEVNLKDAVLSLQIPVGMEVTASCLRDIDGDGKVGNAEAVFILHKLSGE